MSHIGYPIILLNSEIETLVSAQNHLHDLSEDDTVIEVRGPVNFDKSEQPPQAKAKEAPLSGVLMPFILTAEEGMSLHRYIIETGNLRPEAAPSVRQELHTSANIRSNNSFRERVKKDKKPTSNSNRYSEKRWTKQEDYLLLDLYDILGGYWESIARRMPGRTKDTIKKRYLKLMKYPRHFASHGIINSDSYPGGEEELQYHNFIS